MGLPGLAGRIAHCPGSLSFPEGAPALVPSRLRSGLPDLTPQGSESPDAGQGRVGTAWTQVSAATVTRVFSSSLRCAPH